LWAGTIAQGGELPTADEPGSDKSKLLDVAGQLLGKVATAKQIEREIERARRRAERLVKRHREAIEKLADQLLSLYAQIDELATSRKA
jgi:ElaB/YqjD/DUF883 family membrane-anchored ribosome-binding protein